MAILNRTQSVDVDVDYTIDTEEIIDDISTKELFEAILERKKYNGFNKEELGMFSELLSEEPLSDNFLEQMKIDVILPNLWKKSIEEIEAFFK